MSDTALITIPEVEIRLGSLAVTRPADMIVRAAEVATALAQVVKDRKLSRNISGREYVYVEGWATMGAMIGILPREVGVIEHDNGDFEATVELIRVNDGAVVGQGSAIVGYDEPTWKARPRYAKRSMSITRATGKAYRLGFSWIMALAGYAPTLAEEMDGLTDVHADTVDAEFRKLTSATEERAAQGKPPSAPATFPKLAINHAPMQYGKLATAFAAEFPNYQTKHGVFDDGHIRASIMNRGFPEITPENIEVAFAKLSEHALSKEADAAVGK
jgi:hypothetical protein